MGSVRQTHVVRMLTPAACRACATPRLVRFLGRPQDYSPKARLLNLLGYKLPFDRHDWVVDRCGTEARRRRGSVPGGPVCRSHCC